MAATRFLIGLGSNRRDGRHGAPAAIVRAALERLADAGLVVLRASPVRRSPALGPGGRDFANAAALVRTALPPPALLALLKRIERAFGRRPGRRWGARVLDLDILAWEGGAWPPRPRLSTGPLRIPHAGLAKRGFAIGPAAALAPEWRDPRSGRSLRQLDAIRRRARLTATRAGPRTHGRRLGP